MDLATIMVPEPRTGTETEGVVLARLQAHGQTLLMEYLNSYTNNGQTYIGRDAAKKLFPEYLANPTEHNRDCDQVASNLADAARRTVLLQDVEPSRNIAIILTGSPASGKTINAEGESNRKVEIVHETIFTSLDRARTLITEAVEAGRLPIVHLFYTDDPRINLHRMLVRARKIGRTVPIRYMAKTYVDVPLIVEALALEFHGDLIVQVTNNSETQKTAVPHNSVARALYHTQRYTEQGCLEIMRAEIEKTDIRNTLTDAIYREACL